MHAVHDATVVSQDDRIGRVHLCHKLRVLDDPADRRHLNVSVEPVSRVDLANRIDRYAFDREFPAERD